MAMESVATLPSLAPIKQGISQAPGTLLDVYSSTVKADNEQVSHVIIVDIDNSAMFYTCPAVTRRIRYGLGPLLIIVDQFAIITAN